jgi:phytoene dehydrogenase-like protein
MSVIIVGGGVAGLTCAAYLQKKGIDFQIIEAADAVGGRVRTDLVEGFQLDRGFQILNTAYPEARRLLNYESLNLQSFGSGAVIRMGDSFMKMTNPFDEPSAIFSVLGSSVGSLADKLRIFRLIVEADSTDEYEVFDQPSISTLAFLKDKGFSDQIIHNFFRPFFGGVFLEDELATSSNFFQFVFKQFYTGQAALPNLGIEEIPKQIAAKISPQKIRLNTQVTAIEGNSVRLHTGETLNADAIVLALDLASAQRLLGQQSSQKKQFNKTTCTYFAAEKSPLKDKMLVLNPNVSSVVHHVCVPSDVASGYAPAGKALVSVSSQNLTLVDGQELSHKIKKELRPWFGPQVDAWQWLKTYDIPEALPVFEANQSLKPLKISEKLYQCGDATAYPSLNAAMLTGRQVAEALFV